MAQTSQPLSVLTERVLQWMSFSGDVGLPKTLVQQAIRTAHAAIATADHWNFLKWPGGRSLAIRSGQRELVLHPQFHLPRWFRLRSNNSTFLREIADGAAVEYLPDPDATGTPQGFSWGGTVPVEVQPSAAATITLARVGALEIGAVLWTIEGTTAAGLFATETKSGEATTSTAFAKVTRFIKHTGPWPNAITLTANTSPTEVLLTLGASEYGRQHRVIVLDRAPTVADTLDYEFYRLPTDMQYDGQIPDIPAPFSDELLVLDALLLLPGYTRATADELRAFRSKRDELYLQLEQTYADGQSLGAAPVTPWVEPR